MLGLRKEAKRQKDTGRPAYGAQRRSAMLRIQTDLSEFAKSDYVTLKMKPDGDIMEFDVSILIDDGPYKTATISFNFVFPDSYPTEGPKVRCTTLPFYHPNIDWDGNVCLNILREDYVPSLDLNAFVAGLQFILREPTPYDPLNKEAGNMFEADTEQFFTNVRMSLLGKTVGGRKYTRNSTYNM